MERDTTQSVLAVQKQDLIDALTQLLTTDYKTKQSVVEKLSIIKENKKEIEKLTKKEK